MRTSFRSTMRFRRGAKAAVIGSVVVGAMLGSSALALSPPTTKTAGPAPIHASRIGVATGAVYWGETPTAREAEMADLQRMGVRVVRTVFPWSSIERSGPTLDDWQTADSIVASARTHHISLIAQVIGAPRWAVPGMKAGQVSDYGPNPTLFARFVAKFAARYAHLGVTTYELGNEPNHVRSGNQPNAATYTHILCTTYAAVKAVVPTSTVLTGGLGGTKDGPGGFSGPVFVRSLYADGAKHCFDGISYHPYTYPQIAPDNGSRGWSGMLSVRQIMVANGDTAKKIWATEYGAPTNSATPKHVTTEAAQANILTTAYRLFDTYSWAGPICWFDYQDKGTDPQNQNDWFGLRRNNGTPKPAYTALVNLAHAAVA